MSNNTTVKNEQQIPGVYDVRIRAIHLDGPVLADVSATYNGCFAIRGLKLVKGDDGPYVAMPGYESAHGFVEVCTPNTPEAYEQLKEAVLDAYRQKLARMREQSFAFATEPRQENAVREPIPTAVSAKINTLRDGPTLADVSVNIDGAFTVSGVRVISSENGLFVSMPSYRTASGYSDTCFPCTTEFHEQVRSDVLNAYQQTLSLIYDQTASELEQQSI